MAMFKSELPNDLIKQFEELDINTEKMLGEMTKAGCKTIYDNIVKNMPSELKESDFNNTLKLSKIYKTPSDDGINTKTMFVGYFTNDEGKKTPAPLIANLFEYGREESGKKYPKHPFIRKSRNKKQIDEVMQKVQDNYLKGIFK